MLDLMLWMPAEELARRRGVPVSDIVGMAMAGQIESRRQGDRWYVERPLVWLHYPDPTDVTQAELKVFALAMGRYLTAARRMVTIPLRREDPDREESLRHSATRCRVHRPSRCRSVSTAATSSSTAACTSTSPPRWSTSTPATTPRWWRDLLADDTAQITDTGAG